MSRSSSALTEAPHFVAVGGSTFFPFRSVSAIILSTRLGRQMRSRKRSCSRHHAWRISLMKRPRLCSH